MKLGFRQLLFGILLGVLLYGGVVVYSGLAQIQAVLGGFRWGTFAAALGLASTNYALRFGKWQYYLRRLGVAHVPRGHSALIFLSGFVLTVTPGKLGEVFKSAVLARTHQVPVERTAPIVVAERLTDVIAIVVLVVLGSLGFQGGVYWAVLGGLAVAIGLLAITWEAPARAVLGVLQKRRRGAALAERLGRAYDSLRVVASPRALAWPVLLSLVGWGLEGVALHLLLSGFGQHPALSFSVFFYATATLAGALVPVPGGLGVTEAVIHEQLVRVAGAPEDVATACMLLIRLATLWWAVLVGFVALGVLRLEFPRELAAGATAAPPVGEEPTANAAPVSRRARASAVSRRA
jgi:glycosyltransferase 2 family protein